MEKSVLVTGPVYGIFSTACEMLDSPTGPECKIFRFKDDCKWHEARAALENTILRQISVYSYWPPSESLEEPGVCEGTYRITKKMETPPGYRAVVEGTTAPKAKPAPEPVYDPRAAKCEDAILGALEPPRMRARAIYRKIHGERFGKDLWDKCLKTLGESGEIRLEEEEGQVWIVPVSPENDGTVPTI